MAYVFDPINNTLIDDEDKSLGNKLALNDEELQKILNIPGSRIKQEFSVGGMPYSIFGKQIDIPLIKGVTSGQQNKKSVEEGFKKLEKWLKNPTPENWVKTFGKNNAFSYQLRNYLQGTRNIGAVKGMPTAEKVFDAINVKKLLTESQINKILELDTGGKGVSLKSKRARTFGNLKFSMDEVIETIKNFQNGEQWLRRNPDQTAVDTDGKNKYRKYANAIKSMEKERSKLGGFPFGDNSEKKMWSNLYRASYRGNRIKIVGEFADGNLPINEKGNIDWKMTDKNGVQAWKRVKFIDTLAPKNTIFTWGDNFQRGDFAKQVDDTFGEGFFKKSTEAYDTQIKTGSKRETFGNYKTIKSNLKTKILTIEALIDNPKATKEDINKYITKKAQRFNITEVHHPDGVGVNPWKTEPTFRYANRALDKEVMQPLKAGKINAKEAKLRIDKINKEIGPIRTLLDDGYYGEYKNTQKSILEAAENYAKKIKNTLSPKLRSTLTNRLNSGLPIDNILSTIANDLNIPVEQVKNVASKTLRGFGKATAVAEPVFAALDASEAFRAGLSGKQTTNYVVRRFIDGVANLPALVKGGFDFAVDKTKGEDAKFEMPYEVTLGKDYKDRVLEQTPKEILDARKAQLEFDQNILPGMTMVDDMDIPASKAEIEAAKNKFMNEKGVDLSVLDNLEEDKTELSPILKSLVTPDETLQDFMAHGGRAGFSNGGAAGADDNFAAELEYFFTNPDAELPKMQTYKETMNPITILNDIIDPRNYPYYADVLARSGVRIGEFATRILPATGKLVSDLIQKPAFKITGTGNNYVQDYTDVLPSNIKGTGIFSEFLENITPTTLEKKIGLDKLIKTEEQKQIERGSTIGPKVFADTIGLGAEVAAPIFPGLKLLRAYAKAKNLPVNDVTKNLLVKEIDEVLEKQGMDRREFLQATGAGATVVLAKLLGFGDEVAQTAKVAEKATEAAAGGAPTYFFDLVEIIKKKGLDVTKKGATQNLQNVYSYKGYDLFEDLATGEIRIEKTNTGAFKSGDDLEEGIASQDVLEYKPARADVDPDEKTIIREAEEYTEGSLFPDLDGKLKEVEDLDIEELLEFIKNEKAN